MEKINQVDKFLQFMGRPNNKRLDLVLVLYRVIHFRGRGFEPDFCRNWRGWLGSVDGFVELEIWQFVNLNIFLIKFHVLEMIFFLTCAVFRIMRVFVLCLILACFNKCLIFFFIYFLFIITNLERADCYIYSFTGSFGNFSYLFCFCWGRVWTCVFENDISRRTSVFLPNLKLARFNKSSIIFSFFCLS